MKTRTSPSGPVAVKTPQSVFWGSTNAASGEYLEPWAPGSGTSDEGFDSACIPVPFDCYIGDLMVVTHAGPISGSQISFTIVAASLTGAEAATDVEAIMLPGEQEAEDSLNRAELSRGDLIALRADTGGASGSSYVACATLYPR